MLQFLGPEMESSISQIFGRKNCKNYRFIFWAQECQNAAVMLQFPGPEIAVMLQYNFWAQKLQKCKFSKPKLCVKLLLIIKKNIKSCRPSETFELYNSVI